MNQKEIDHKKLGDGKPHQFLQLQTGFGRRRVATNAGLKATWKFIWPRAASSTSCELLWQRLEGISAPQRRAPSSAQTWCIFRRQHSCSNELTFTESVPRVQPDDSAASPADAPKSTCAPLPIIQNIGFDGTSTVTAPPSTTQKCPSGL